MKPSDQLAHILFEFSYWHAMQGHPFRPQVYELAYETVQGYGSKLHTIWKKSGLKGLEELPGIGEAIASKIDEFYRTGHVHEYEDWKKSFPVDIWGLSRIEGLGPKHIKVLWEKLHVSTLEDLDLALSDHKVRSLPGFGTKSEERLAHGLELMRSSSPRKSLAKILPIANRILKRLSQLPDVKECAIAGSIRRRKATVGDIDLIATSSKPERIMDAFTHFPEVESIHEVGKTRSSVRLKIGLDADLRVVPDAVFGSTLQYFTGDRRHNILLRERAIKLGYKLNEYGLFKGKKLIPSKTEDDIYRTLGLETPPPEKRLGTTEFIARKKTNKKS